MGFITEYLKYLSIAIFGFFILIHSPIIQADEINEHTVDYVFDNYLELNGQTIMVPGHLFYMFDETLSVGSSVPSENLMIFPYQLQDPALFVNASKISKKQKKWVNSNCELGDDAKGGCYVYLTGVVNDMYVVAIEIKKMGMKDKLTNIAIGKKNQLLKMGDIDTIKLKLLQQKYLFETLLE
tara:strand:- start:43 stop:588 length:546 start_codon:yes stop_codon:yes gene_type:complete